MNEENLGIFLIIFNFLNFLIEFFDLLGGSNVDVGIGIIIDNIGNIYIIGGIRFLDFEIILNVI